MRKEYRAIVVAGVIFILGAGLSYSATPEPVDVEKVVVHPEKFTGPVIVFGRIAKAVTPNGFFALGCEDACVSMPVKYSGTLPAAGSDVIVSGQIVKGANGRYLFSAQSVALKK